MTASLTPISELAGRDLSGCYVVFGGTFDPCHEGHVTVIEALRSRFPRIIIAPTARNPWKDAPPTALELRCEMLRLVLKHEQIPFGADPSRTGVSIYSQQYVYAEELVSHLRSTQQGELFWAVGEDTADGVPRWRNWSELRVPTLVLPVLIEVHAEQIRAHSANPHRALSQFITEKKLYSNGPE